MPDETADDNFEELAVERAFGAENRQRIIEQYFASADEPVTTDNAWQHVYQLLLWINPTISLAHCYESDKCQPGKSWYPRSLAFHAWVSGQLSVDPHDLHEHIDFMFRTAAPNLVRIAAVTRRGAAATALSAYPPGSMPVPGDDPELVETILGVLGDEVLPPGGLDEQLSRDLVERVHAHFGLENKRKNLLGRGFEDVLAALVRRLPGADAWEVRTRVPLKNIPGFAAHGPALERAEIDLALWQKQSGGRRILVSAKWSVRADRERQFDSDFDDYGKANSAGPFEYVLITNEFDAARLYAAATKVRGNEYLFKPVVHVQPDGVLVAYGDQAKAAPLPQGGAPGRYKSRYLPTLIEAGRLGDLESWLESVLGP